MTINPIFHDALLEAASIKDVDMVCDLLNEYGRQNPASEGTTPLHLACELGLTTIAMFLLEYTDISINSTNSYNHTPLLFACLFNHYKLANYLLDYPGINPNIAAKNGMTPLGAAIINGDMSMVKLLLADSRVDINLVSENKATPLIVALTYAQKAMIDLLLADKRTDVNVGIRDYMTPLMITIATDRLTEEEKLHYLKELVRCGANIYLRTTSKNGYNNALSFAMRVGTKPLVRYLLQLHPCAVDETIPSSQGE